MAFSEHIIIWEDRIRLRHTHGMIHIKYLKPNNADRDTLFPLVTFSDKCLTENNYEVINFQSKGQK